MNPSYIAAIVSIAMAVQPLLGLELVAQDWSAFIIVVSGIIAAVQEILKGRSNWFGGRPR